MKIEINNKAYKWLRRIICVSLILIFQFSIFTLTSCSTQKAKWLNVRYHNLTCHYNVWWNGNESLKAGRLKMKRQAVDDYTQLIPVENTGSDELARSLNPEFDRTIEKGIKGIKKHSIFVKGEEHVPYIKECYIMMAYATFYKHDYVATANTCHIIINQFSGTRAGDEGAVLLARCMTKEKQYSEAEATLDQLVRNLEKGNFSRSQRDKLYIAMVEATVPQEKYKKAVEYIHLAIDASSDSYTRARLTFLLAQIYRKLDKRPVAAKYYDKVLDYSPTYVLEFNAKLGSASCADLQYADIPKLESRLDDMLSDKKNLEYRDQIYFAKGEMYLGIQQPQKACDNYRLSVAVSNENKAQRALSSIRLGQVLYDLFENYDLSQRYYDTAMQIITRDYPGYDAIKRRYDILTELVSYTRVYSRCDSLMAVVALPEKERRKLINDKIEKLKKEEQEAREREMLNEILNENKQQQNTLKGDWYFYNPQTVQKGKETFRQRWGMRPLEDLWVLSNKNTLSMLVPDEEPLDDTISSDLSGDSTALASTTSSKDGNPDDPHHVAFYLKDLPSTPAQFDSIDSLTAISLLNAAYLFYDGVHNIPRALECYHRLADQYTSFPQIVQAFYMLYRIYDRQGNTPQANYYRDMVLMGFPDSDFANLIRDNEFYKELIRRQHIVQADYEELYTHYIEGRYSQVLDIASRAEENYPGNPMLDKFRFWKGLALAGTGRRSLAIEVFQALAALPPSDTLQPLAQNQLNLLLDDNYAINEEIEESDSLSSRKPSDLQPAVTTSQTTPVATTTASPDDELPPESQIYRYRQNQQLFIVIIVDDRVVRATELQYKIAAFNSQYYSNSGYKVNATLFTDTTQILTIHTFLTDDEALNYWHHLQQDESPLRQLPDSSHQEFAITSQNYATFYNRKNPAAYQPFFNKYYLKKEK